MYRWFITATALAALVGCGSGNSSTVRVMTDEERAAVEQRKTAVEEAERARRQTAAERSAAAYARAAEMPPPARADSLLDRMMDADGRGMCNLRLVAAARATTNESGTLHRWTTIDLEGRFPEKRAVSDTVTAYLGNALEFMEDDGSWLRSVYECSYDHDAGEVVDVRAVSR